jgi:hypothetical protein
MEKNFIYSQQSIKKSIQADQYLENSPVDRRKAKYGEKN